MPKRNEKDLVDVPRDIQRGLRLVMAERMDDVLAQALLPKAIAMPKPRTRRPRARKQPAILPAEAPAEGIPAAVAG
jgi:hypothetical protein